MKVGSLTTSMQSKNIMRIVLVTAAVLLVPLVAMQFTDQVAWSLSDFVVAAALLIGTGLLYELGVKKVRSVKYQTVIGVGLVAVFFLVWLELAVGIFGASFSGS